MRVHRVVALLFAVASTTAPIPEDVSAQPAASSELAPGCSAGARRIISFVPAVTSTLAELGLTACLVGRAADDRTPAAQAVPVAGTVLVPNAEHVLASRPDLVITWHDPLPPQLERAARLSEARLERVSMTRLHELGPAVRALGSMTARHQEADALEQHLRAEFAAVRALVPEGSPPRLVWAVGLEPLMVAGPETLPDDLMRLVGATNAFADAGAPWARLSLEAVTARPVDAVVWPVGGDLPPFDALPPDAAWRRVITLNHTRVIELPADLVHEAGPHLPGAARALFEQLYPDSVALAAPRGGPSLDE